MKFLKFILMLLTVLQMVSMFVVNNMVEWDAKIIL